MGTTFVIPVYSSSKDTSEEGKTLVDFVIPINNASPLVVFRIELPTPKQKA